MESPTSPASRVDFYDFLDRMRRPAAAGLFRSIKSFLTSLTLDEPNAEEDGKKVQTFFAVMETSIKEHPLWANATNQEIDHALEGLEKYIMTKLFDRTFASSAEDAIADMEISDKIALLQQFVSPHHLDIPKVLRNEASWLLAVKELQKINSLQITAEKLLCIMSCCQVINNLLLNVSMSNDRTPSGADEFLPILIYITIKANPPQLHSNLKFVQLFRRETKLISEVEYYLTNLISAKMFIINVNGNSLSMEEREFQEHMESARLGTQTSAASPSSSQGLATSTRVLHKETDTGGSRFPFMDSETESLTPAEVKQLHELYRQVVTRYSLLSKALRKLSIDEDQLLDSENKRGLMVMLVRANAIHASATWFQDAVQFICCLAVHRYCIWHCSTAIFGWRSSLCISAAQNCTLMLPQAHNLLPEQSALTLMGFLQCSKCIPTSDWDCWTYFRTASEGSD